MEGVTQFVKTPALASGDTETEKKKKQVRSKEACDLRDAVNDL